jgi:hypothetical protein
MRASFKFVSLRLLGLSLLVLAMPSGAQTESPQPPLLTVKEVMNAIITPMTSIIWGAYDLKSDAEWKQVENAALTVLAAGDLLAHGGAGQGETASDYRRWEKG